MRILVTVGAGLIGSHLVVPLLERSDPVTVRDVIDSRVHEDQQPTSPDGRGLAR